MFPTIFSKATKRFRSSAPLSLASTHEPAPHPRVLLPRSRATCECLYLFHQKTCFCFVEGTSPNGFLHSRLEPIDLGPKRTLDKGGSVVLSQGPEQRQNQGRYQGARAPPKAPVTRPLEGPARSTATKGGKRRCFSQAGAQSNNTNTNNMKHALFVHFEKYPLPKGCATLAIVPGPIFCDHPRPFKPHGL